MIAVRKHCAEEHEKQPNSCEECRLIFSTEHQAYMHKNKVHREKQKFPCSLCNEVFNIKKTLNAHKFKVHGDTSVTHYKCDHCDYATTTQSHYQDHVNASHTRETLHKCPHCDFTTYRNGGLKAHISDVHKKRRNFKCAKCPAEYINSRELNKHKLSKNH